jgi:septum formation protein
MPSTPRLCLASTSRYRTELLGRLRIPFSTVAPDVDETPLPDEPAQTLAARLARAKALKVADTNAGTWVLGSDQAASTGALRLEKPGTLSNAREQLRAMSGQQVQFHTAYALCRDGVVLQGADLTTVHLRTLSDAEIDHYLNQEPALDCAGSFKCEGLGITLFDAIETRDPTALIGLPLIGVAALLRQTGFSLP